MNRQIKVLIGKLLVIKPLYGILTRLFFLANEEIYERFLIKCPILEFSIGKDWVRAPMYAAIFEFFRQLSNKENLKNKISIEIGGSEGSIKTILERFGVDYKVAPNFPEVDIHNLAYDDEVFDFLVLDQVLEHTRKPWEAVKEIFRVLKPGGISIVTGPFMIGYHGARLYKDYCRFTPDGWRDLFSDFEIMEVGGWGNARIIRTSLLPFFVGTEFGKSISVNKAIRRRLLRHNDGKNYLVTWCIARKHFD